MSTTQLFLLMTAIYVSPRLSDRVGDMLAISCLALSALSGLVEVLK